LILVLIFFSKATTHKQFIHKEFIPNTKPWQKQLDGQLQVIESMMEQLITAIGGFHG
jgi:hypothetical protein